MTRFSFLFDLLIHPDFFFSEHDESKKNYFDWENNNGKLDPNTQIARVFAAETISSHANREIVRKISIAAGEFRTIETQEGEEEEDEEDGVKEGCDNNNEKSRRDNNNTEAPGKKIENKDSSEGNITSNSSSNSLNQLQFAGEKQSGGGGGGGKRKRRKKSMKKKNSISNIFNNNNVSDSSQINISGELSVQKSQDCFAPVYSRSEMDNVPKVRD